MRYIVAAIVLCSFAPAALALPVSGAAGFSASKSGEIVQVSKKGGGKSARGGHGKKGGGLGGIHPLVGSGDY